MEEINISVVYIAPSSIFTSGVRVLSVFHYHHYYITALVSSMFLNGGS